MVLKLHTLFSVCYYDIPGLLYEHSYNICNSFYWNCVDMYFLRQGICFEYFFIYIFNLWELFLLYTRTLQEWSEKNVWKLKNRTCVSLSGSFLILIVIICSQKSNKTIKTLDNFIFITNNSTVTVVLQT